MNISRNAYIRAIIKVLNTIDGQNTVQYLPEVSAEFTGKVSERLRDSYGNYSLGGVTFVVKKYVVLFFRDEDEYRFLDDEDYDECLAFGILDEDSPETWCRFFENEAVYYE